MNYQVFVLLSNAIHASLTFSDELRQRGFAGFRYRDLRQADLVTLKLAAAAGHLCRRYAGEGRFHD